MGCPLGEDTHSFHVEVPTGLRGGPDFRDRGGSGGGRGFGRCTATQPAARPEPDIHEPVLLSMMRRAAPCVTSVPCMTTSLY